jgi:hypothetical protein
MQFESLADVEWTPHDHVNSRAEILRLVGPESSALSVSAHLPASRDEHQDFTSYELTLNSHRVVVDSGGFTGEEREYFPRPRAHNILMVDGREPRWKGAKSPAAAPVDFQKLSHERARLQIADPGYGFLGLHHDRAWFRLENNVWLILDWLDGKGEHDLTSIIHFYPTFEIACEGDRVLARSRACKFAVIPVSTMKPLASISRGDHPQFPGWFSPEFGVKFPAAALALHRSGVKLPWLGGVLITSDSEEPFRLVEMIPAERRVRIEFSGNTYDVQME